MAVTSQGNPLRKCYGNPTLKYEQQKISRDWNGINRCLENFSLGKKYNRDNHSTIYSVTTDN